MELGQNLYELENNLLRKPQHQYKEIHPGASVAEIMVRRKVLGELTYFLRN